MQVFAANLRQRIADLDLTQAEAARRCGLEGRRFHHYLVGDREPNLSTLLRISEVLGTTPDALLGAKPVSPIGADEAGRLRAKLLTAAAGLDPPSLRLLNVLVDGVIAYRHDGGGKAAVGSPRVSRAASTKRSGR